MVARKRCHISMDNHFKMATAPSSNSLTKLRKQSTSQTSVAQSEKQSASETEAQKDGENPLAWKVLDESQIEDLKPLTPPEIEERMAKILGLQDYPVCLIEGAKLDYFVGGFLFGIEQNFDNFQISCLLGLLEVVLENCKNKMSLEANVKDMTRYFTGIKKWGESHVSGMEKFNVDQSKKIIDFMYEGIFQHYTLYQYMLLENKEEEIVQQQVEMQLLPCAEVPFPSPLHEGLPLDLYEKYIAPPPQNLQDTDKENQDLNAEEMKSKSSTGISIKDLSPSPSEKEAVADMILKNLKPDEIKQIVEQMTGDALGAIKSEAETKIKDRETAIVSKLNRLHLT